MDSSLVIFLLLILVVAAHIRIGGIQNRLDGKSAGKSSGKPERIQLPREPRLAKSAPALRSRSKAAKPSGLWKWLSTDWPMKLGAFLILLAFAWLTSYAFVNNWIGPMGRPPGRPTNP